MRTYILYTVYVVSAKVILKIVYSRDLQLFYQGCPRFFKPTRIVNIRLIRIST